jgi:hypothetical protein
VEADGRFSTVGYPAGRYTMGASVPISAQGGPPAQAGSPAWTLKSIMFDGRDVGDEGLDIGTDDVSGIVIAFTDQTTEISGAVVDTKGQADVSASVVAFPADSQTWKQGLINLRRVRSVRTGTSGGFSFMGLPPGAYFIVAVSDAALGEWQDPTVLEKLAGVASKVTLADGEKKTQALTTKTIR